MCNILGIIADRRVDTEASLRAMVPANDPHRWRDALGVSEKCTLYKSHRFSSDIAISISDDVFIARSCNAIQGSLTSEHPFRSGKWTFAHDGMIDDVSSLRRRISPARATQVESDTASELLFACVLGWLDATEPSDVALERATSIIAREVHGSLTFVLSDGASMYAYRRGRPLFVLERDAAVLFATEPITNDGWLALSNGTLVRADRDPLAWRFLKSPTQIDSRPELPFTD